MKHHFDQRTKSRQFATGDQVLGKDFTSLEKWQPAEVLQHTEHSPPPTHTHLCEPATLTTSLRELPRLKERRTLNQILIQIVNNLIRHKHPSKPELTIEALVTFL